MFNKNRVDSAQLLASLFIPIDTPPLVVGYARFWHEFVAFADANSFTGRTVAEVRELSTMMLAVAPKSVTDGWAVVVDGCTSRYDA
jgi:hypothetical protein